MSLGRGVLEPPSVSYCILYDCGTLMLQLLKLAGTFPSLRGLESEAFGCCYTDIAQCPGVSSSAFRSYAVGTALP